MVFVCIKFHTHPSVYSWQYLQAPGDDFTQEPDLSRTQAVISVTLFIYIWPGHQIQARQADASGKFPASRNTQRSPQSHGRSHYHQQNRHIQIRQETASCLILSVVYCLMCHGLPAFHWCIPKVAWHYWDMCTELFTDKDILFKVHCIIILWTPQDPHLTDIHEGHQGIS